VELLDQAEADARRAGVRVTDIPFGRGMLAQLLGQTETARAELERAADWGHALGDAWRESEALFALTQAALERGDLVEARRAVDRALPVTSRLLGGSEPAYARGLKALVALREAQTAGQPGEAAALELAAAGRELEQMDANFRVVRLVLLRAEGDLDAGRVADVEDAIRRIEPWLPLPEHHSGTLEVFTFLAEAALVRGRAAEARHLLDQAMQAVARGGLVPASKRARLERLVLQVPHAVLKGDAP